MLVGCLLYRKRQKRGELQLREMNLAVVAALREEVASNALTDFYRPIALGHDVMLPIDGSLVKVSRRCVMLPTVVTKKNPAAVALGRRKSAKKAAASAKNARRATRIRMTTFSPQERSEQAKQAALTRWKGKAR
jgi:hypothetical protein